MEGRLRATETWPANHGRAICTRNDLDSTAGIESSLNGFP